MKPISTNLRSGLVLTLLVVFVSACSSKNNTTADNGGGGGTTTTPPPVVVAPPNQEDKFGTVFGNAYRASANGEPFVVQDGDLIPVSLTAEPEVVN